MGEPDDLLDLNKPFPRVSKPADFLEIDKSFPYIETLDLSWGVFDVGTSDVLTFDSPGGHFQSAQGHRYLVFLRVSDKKGVQRIGLDGSGYFRCASLDGNTVDSSARQLSIPHQEYVNTGVAPSLQDLVVIMWHDIGAFNYFALSGGFRYNSGKKTEVFAYSGVMTFSGSAVNSRGDMSATTLTTSP
jgi:hypothetical protein